MKYTVSRADQPASENPPGRMQPPADFAVSHHGTVSLFHPLTEAAMAWLRLHCPHDDEHQYFGKALAIEPRFVAKMVELATDDGLSPATFNQGRN